MLKEVKSFTLDCHQPITEKFQRIKPLAPMSDLYPIHTKA